MSRHIYIKWICIALYGGLLYWIGSSHVHLTNYPLFIFILVGMTCLLIIVMRLFRNSDT